MAEHRDNHVVVLGAPRTLGVACCRAFKAQNWRCFLADDDSAALDAARDQLGSDLDICHETPGTRLGLRSIMAEAREKLGYVDTVIHIPPSPPSLSLMAADSDSFEAAGTAPREVSAVIHAFARWMREGDDASPALKTNQAGFVHIFGISANQGDSGTFSRNASDSMAVALIESAALDLAHMGLRCNALVALRPRAAYEEAWLEERTPLGRACQASEIADAAFFLSAPGAANMTGQTLTMDGGRARLNGVLGPTPQ